MPAPLPLISAACTDAPGSGAPGAGLASTLTPHIAKVHKSHQMARESLVAGRVQVDRVCLSDSLMCIAEVAREQWPDCAGWLRGSGPSVSGDIKAVSPRGVAGPASAPGSGPGRPRPDARRASTRSGPK